MKQYIADFDMYKTIHPITFYKSTYDSHFRQSRPLNLFLKDVVDRMSVYLKLISYSDVRFERVNWKNRLKMLICIKNLSFSPDWCGSVD